MHNDKVQPTRETYHAVFRALARYCYYDEVIVFYEDMLRMKISPTSQTFAYLLQVRLNYAE